MDSSTSSLYSQPATMRLPRMGGPDPASRKAIFRFSEQMSQDQDFSMTLRFERLSVFSILCLQQQLRQLDERVTRVMKGVESIESADEDELMLEVRRKLKEYHEAVLTQSSVSKLSSPPPRARSNVNTFLCSKEHRPMWREFGNVTDTKTKLVAFTEHRKAWVHTFIDSYPRLRSPFSVAKVEGSCKVETWSAEQIRRVLDLVVLSGFCLLILIPVLVLLWTPHLATGVVVVSASIGCVTVMTSLFTRASSTEVLTVVATYASIMLALLNGKK